jgi:hypothetical protein
MSRPTADLSRGEWLIGLEDWVIPDENYGDFEIGQRRRFAIELSSHNGLGATGHRTSAADLRPDLSYDICGKVTYRSAEVTVIDFGLLAYAQKHEKVDAADGWVAGNATLTVDPFMYADEYARDPSVPPAIYSWIVEAIWAETGPMMTVRHGILRRAAYKKRDPRNVSWVSVPSTADRPAESHPGYEAGSAYLSSRTAYVLRCRLGDEPPVRGPKD